MNFFEKWLSVLAKNLGVTIVLVIAIILFAIFADGLLAGIITALSAMLVYVCCGLLYKEYQKLPSTKSKKKK